MGLELRSNDSKVGVGWGRKESSQLRKGVSQELMDFFCESPVDGYFWLCELYCLRHRLSILLQGKQTATNNTSVSERGYVPIKVYLQNPTTGFIRLRGQAYRPLP